MKVFFLHLAVSVLAALASIVLYDHLVLRPRQMVGVVDAAQVFQAKEAQLVRAMADSRTEEQRREAIADAQHFAASFSTALAELPDECQCLVIDKAAVIGARQALLDLTPVLKRKVRL